MLDGQIVQMGRIDPEMPVDMYHVFPSPPPPPCNPRAKVITVTIKGNSLERDIFICDNNKRCHYKTITRLGMLNFSEILILFRFSSRSEVSLL